MDAVTYPDQRIVQLLGESFVCARPQIDQNVDLARRFGVKWTPGLLWLDPQGNARHESVGFFTPDEFLAECTFGLGRVAAATGNWVVALPRFEEVVARWPHSFAAPAALYWSAVAAYSKTGKQDALVERWRRLLDEHPKSAWAMKVSFLDKKAR